VNVIVQIKDFNDEDGSSGEFTLSAGSGTIAVKVSLALSHMMSCMDASVTPTMLVPISADRYTKLLNLQLYRHIPA
jgi:hypothetical protein